MKILFLPNWKVEHCLSKPDDKQSPDYYSEDELYWFFKYFDYSPEVDVLDIRSFPLLERLERNKFRFYIWQALRTIPKLNRYDIIVSHGMQSGIVISLWRCFFRARSRHVVFDIGAFNSAAESGMALKLMQYASKSIDGIIYHTSSQKTYYDRYFPWLVDKATFIRFGTDASFFGGYIPNNIIDHEDLQNEYCICVGYNKRDWETLVKAFVEASLPNLTLKLVGHVDNAYADIPNIVQIGYIPIRELMKQIYYSSFGILPLKYYNYSYGQMTLMQQMAMGKCVIVSEVPSIVDYVEDNKTAVLYEPENEHDLASKLGTVYKSKDLREQIGIAAKEYILERCNEPIMAKQIEKTLLQFM